MPQEVSLNSFLFVAISILAIMACRLVGSRHVRELVIALFSLYFVSTFMVALPQLTILATFLLLVYAVGAFKAWSARPLPAGASLAIVMGFWAGLFMLKDPALFGVLNPFHGHAIQIIGISYIVFRGICFVLEVKPGDRLNPLTFFNYMLFFPTLLAGPIERYARFDQTLESPLAWNATGYAALNRILDGAIKKYVIADNLMDFGIFSMMSQGGDFSMPMLWLGAVTMLLLLYLDFSGYCDIVIGVAVLMGVKIVENFDKPFASRNLQEFWSRWHMSLTSVIQDYVFSPLSKLVIIHVPRHRQTYGIALAYVLSMILVAMWHGTTLGFLIFGILQGAVLFAIQIRRERARVAAKAKGIRVAAKPPSMISVWSGRAATYAFVSVTMIWWHSSLAVAIATYRALLGWR